MKNPPVFKTIAAYVAFHLNEAMAIYPIIRNGIPQIAPIQSGMVEWREEHEYESVSQLKGSLSQKNCAEPAAFERAQYMKALTSFAMPRT